MHVIHPNGDSLTVLCTQLSVADRFHCNGVASRGAGKNVKQNGKNMNEHNSLLSQKEENYKAFQMGRAGALRLRERLPIR